MAEEKIKVLETIRQGKIGGGERHVIDLVERLDKTIFEPVVLAFTEGEMIDYLNNQGIRTHVIPSVKPFDFKVWKQVELLMEDESIDIVHAHGTRACSNSYQPANNLGLPLLYTIHGWSFHPGQHFIIKKLRKLTERFLLHKAYIKIFVSEDNCREAQKSFHVKDAKVVKNGIDLNKFQPGKYPSLRHEWGLNDEDIVVGFIVRMTAQKDPLTLIKAMSLVVAENPSVKLLMVGDGDLKAKSVKMVRERKLENHIIFEGFREDVPALLESIDIYCLPSLWEGLPIGLLEAMAMEKAVIATPVNGTKEIIENHNNGMLVPVQNAEQLARAILTVAGNTTYRDKICKNARKTIEKSFNVNKMVQAIEDLYKSYANYSQSVAV